MNSEKKHIREYRITWPNGKTLIVTKAAVKNSPKLKKAIEYIEAEYCCCGLTLSDGTKIDEHEPTEKK